MLVTRLLAPPQALDAGPEDIHGNAFSGRKIFGFTDNLDTLNRWLGDMADAERKQLARLRQAAPNETQTERDRRYADLTEIYEELDEATKLHRRLGCPVIDISELSIEETAHRVLRVIEERRGAPA